jgi:Tol biopolymer transport system component
MIWLAAIVFVSCTAGGGGTSTAPASTVEGRIAFDRMNGAVDYEGPYLSTFVADAEGSNEQEVPIPEGFQGPASPVWSPDGSSLVVSLWREPNGPGQPAIIDPDGAVVQLLKPGKLDASMGCSAWSPDGSNLLCSVDSRHYGLEGMYSIGADGKGLTRLTTSPFHDTHGSAGECGGGDSEGDYSPDGSRFVFMRKRCGTGPDPSSDEAGALFVAKADGTGLHKITAYGGVLSHPGGSVRWSPDGTQILFLSQDHRLQLIHPDGSAATEVNLPAGTAYGPAWSPDGRWIVFSLASPQSPGLAHIYRAWQDGTHLTKVSNAADSDLLVNWGH